MTQAQKWQAYLETLKQPFIKLCKLEFLHPGGATMFVLDGSAKRGKAFIQSGNLTCNLQNGMRRQANITLENMNHDYDFSVGKLWFGQQVRLWEGLQLPSGEDFYLPQGVFYISEPQETWSANQREIQLNLVDKWAMLDGTLGGGLEGTYEVPVGSNIFEAMESLLLQDKGNGIVYDKLPPVFTDYYTQSQLESPYTYRCDSESGTIAEIILGLNEMICGWVGYDCTGRLRIDASQDDILDTTKPVVHSFRADDTSLTAATYTHNTGDMYNDVVIRGEALGTDPQANGRATNNDPKSDTNVRLIGRKTLLEDKSGYYTNQMCEWYAEWKLKRATVLQKSVTLTCSQLFHLQENNLINVLRTDKEGKPVERHLVQGFSRPIAQQGSMTITATSVNDFPIATIVTDSFT